MANNKIVYYGETLLDLSTDTLHSADQLLQGVRAHSRSGEVITGTLEAGKNGATLTVDVPAGSTTTVSKGSESYSSTAAPAVFYGLGSGTWTVTIRNSAGATVSTHVDIVADYSAALSFFNATISISYPAGSTCTVTDGETVLHAPDTSGSWDCAVRKAGTWTVSASGGAKTATQEVQISTNGQSVSVILSFSLILYDAGNEYSAVTGGWAEYGQRYSQTGDAGYKPKQSSEIQFANEGGKYYVKTNNVINLSGYSKLCVHVISIKTVPAADYAPTLKITSGAGANDGTVKAQLAMYASSSGQATVSDRTYELAIGTATSGYVAVSLASSNNGYVRIDKIWAEWEVRA